MESVGLKTAYRQTIWVEHYEPDIGIWLAVTTKSVSSVNSRGKAIHTLIFTM